MSKEIILGAERPLLGYQNERREIHLRRNIELSVPLEYPTLLCSCNNCQEQLVVFYELSTPHSVECPDCGHKNMLMKCIGCGDEWHEGNQAFIEMDVPYGSRVHDSFIDGPAYACSTECLLEAFRDDDFNAREC